MSKRKYPSDEMDDRREFKNQFPEYEAGRDRDMINSAGQVN